MQRELEGNDEKETKAERRKQRVEKGTGVVQIERIRINGSVSN